MQHSNWDDGAKVPSDAELVSDFLNSARSLMTVGLSIQTHGPKPSHLVAQVTTGNYWAAIEAKSIGHIRLRSPPKASLESNRLSTDLPGQSAYLGVGIVVTMPPGAISVLVPLPLLVKSPWPAPPESVVVCMRPTLPVVKAGPRGVNTA